MLVCSRPSTKLSESMACRHSHTRSTSHFLRRWVTPRGEKAAAFFFMRNPPLHTQASFKPWDLGEGHLSGAASYRAPPCARDPKTSESSNDQMKSAERTSIVRGTRATGRLQTTQEKGRQFSAVGRLTPSRRALQAAALSHYLMDVMASLSCPTHQRSPQMLCVRTGSSSGKSSSRYHGNCSSAQALGDRERVLTHPARRRPRPSRPHALIGRAGRGRALRPRPAAGDEPGAPPAEASRPRVSCPLPGALASAVASGRGGHLESW